MVDRYTDHYNNILVVNDLNVQILEKDQYFPILENINFSLKEGEIIAFTGESNAGKSTLALSILNLLSFYHPYKKYSIEGEISFKSQLLGKINLLQLSEDNIWKIRGKEIGFLSQKTKDALNPTYTCGRQIIETIYAHKKMIRRKMNSSIIDLFNQMKFFDNPQRIFRSYPHQISTEEKQIVSIAISVACSPTLLIADEPTQSLNTIAERNILDFIKELKQKGNSILIFSQNLDFIQKVADKVFILYRGNILEKGKVEDIFTKPQRAYTKALLLSRSQSGLYPLPYISDFIRIDNKGNMLSYDNSLVSKIESIIEENKQSAKNIKNINTQSIPNQAILSVKNLTIYPVADLQFSSIEDINFDIFTNEILGIIGNSEDKHINSLIKSILGIRFWKKATGEIIFKDKLLLKDGKTKTVGKDIQIISHPYCAYLDPHLRISEIMSEIMKVHQIGETDKERKEIAIKLLESVMLNEHFLDYFPNECSQDECLKICIAEILIVNPQLIIWNNIKINMSMQAQIFNLLFQLKKIYKLTYLFISNDLSAIRYISDRVILMHKGMILETRLTEEFYNDPQSDYGKKLISAMNYLRLQ